MTTASRRGELTEPEDIKRFLQGKHAVFTLQSSRTDKHLTFQLDGTALYWMRGGLEGRAEWLGTLSEDRSCVSELRGAGPLPLSISGPYQASAAFRWLHAQLYNHNADKLAQVRFFHEGKCSACGRPLTNPESIQRGLGPICAERLSAG
jgi:hypothetical protein